MEKPDSRKIFNGLNGYDVKSAGTEANARIKVTDVHIGWADMGKETF